MISILFRNNYREIEIRKVLGQDLFKALKDYKKSVSYPAEETDALISWLPLIESIHILEISGVASRHLWIEVYFRDNKVETMQLSVPKPLINGLLTAIPQEVMVGVIPVSQGELEDLHRTPGEFCLSIDRLYKRGR